MGFSGPVEDRTMIRELYSAYSDAAFRADEEAYLACWDDEGIRIGQGMEVRGKPAIREQWGQFWRILERMGFFNEVGAIEVDGDRAQARCYCREIIRLHDGAIWKVVGVYHDQLVRRANSQVPSRREYELLIDEGRPG
jgi:ketosteroid isomerase-like protein